MFNPCNLSRLTPSCACFHGNSISDDDGGSGKYPIRQSANAIRDLKREYWVSRRLIKCFTSLPVSAPLENPPSHAPPNVSPTQTTNERYGESRPSLLHTNFVPPPHLQPTQSIPFDLTTPCNLNYNVQQHAVAGVHIVVVRWDLRRRRTQPSR